MSANITLDGRCGRDPELKISANGKAVTRMSVVTNGRKKDESGQWVDTDTTWWNITWFGAVAEAVAEQVTKGDRVVVTGRVRDEKWTAPDGSERSTKAVVGDTFGVRKRTETKYDQNQPTASGSDPWASEAPF